MYGISDTDRSSLSGGCIRVVGRPRRRTASSSPVQSTRGLVEFAISSFQRDSSEDLRTTRPVADGDPDQLTRTAGVADVPTCSRLRCRLDAHQTGSQLGEKRTTVGVV